MMVRRAGVVLAPGGPRQAVDADPRHGGCRLFQAQYRGGAGDGVTVDRLQDWRARRHAGCCRYCRGGARSRGVHGGVRQRVPGQPADGAALPGDAGHQRARPAAMDIAGPGAVGNLGCGGAREPGGPVHHAVRRGGVCGLSAQWTGEAILDNAQFDLVIATAIGLGLALIAPVHGGRAPPWRSRGACDRIVVVVARLRRRPCASSRRWCCSIRPTGQRFRQCRSGAPGGGAHRANSGPVACDYKVVCRLPAALPMTIPQPKCWSRPAPPRTRRARADARPWPDLCAQRSPRRHRGVVPSRGGP